jgi:hypothetical protein
MTEIETEVEYAAEEEEAERWAKETPEEAGLAPEVDYERLKKWVIQRDGKPYVQYVGLLDMLHQVSGGDFTITTRLEQAPTAENGMLAIVAAVVSLGPDSARVASGLGDASAESVNRMMAPHLVRMAETRAKGRALRDLLNIGLVTLEELGPGGGGGNRDTAAASTGTYNPDGIVIEGRRYTRPQIWDAYLVRMKQMREAKLSITHLATLNQESPLAQLAGATQAMKKKLAEAGKLPPPANGRST